MTAGDPLEQAERLLKDITPGAWRVDKVRLFYCEQCHAEDWADADGYVAEAQVCAPTGKPHESWLIANVSRQDTSDAQFIAAAPQLVRDLVAELRRLQQIRAWQPIATCKADDNVLVAFIETAIRKRPRRSFVGEAERRHGGLWWWPNDYESGAIYPQPTHWQPLPDPPALGSDGISQAADAVQP